MTAEAAGVVVMDNSLERVDEFMHISRRMRSIALQSAVGGMALSVIGMAFAATGRLSPVISFEFIAIHGMGSSVPGALTIFLSVLVVPGVPHTEHVNEPHDGEGKRCTVHACEDNGTPTASDSRRATLPSFVVETSAG